MGDTVDVRHRATALMGPEIFHQAISQKELDSATDAASWRLLMAVSLMESSYLRIVVCSLASAILCGRVSMAKQQLCYFWTYVSALCYAAARQKLKV